MNISFIPVNFTSKQDCEILAKWFNDPEINYLISPNFNQGPLGLVTPEFISQANLFSKFQKYAFFIVCDNNIIGDINILDNPDFLYVKDFNSAWLGITIGEKAYQGLGIGKIAMNFIEEYAKNCGFERMELGVFGFNTKAINFYLKLGYKHIGSIPNFTYYNGEWHDDLRFEKFL
ncbi:MAG TPA: GNAT family protein [Haloplasmataceae bacterium]